MATYLAHDALRLPAASLLAYSGLCVNIEIKIWLLLGVNVDTANNKRLYQTAFGNISKQSLYRPMLYAVRVEIKSAADYKVNLISTRNTLFPQSTLHANAVYIMPW